MKLLSVLGLASDILRQVLKRTALHSLAVSASVNPPVVYPATPFATHAPPPPTLAQPPPPIPAPRSSVSSEGSAYLRRGSEASNSSFQSFIFPSGPAQADFARLTAESAAPLPLPPQPVLRPVGDAAVGVPAMEMDAEPTPGLRMHMGPAGAGQHRRMGPGFVDSTEGAAYAYGAEALRLEVLQHQQANCSTAATNGSGSPFGRLPCPGVIGSLRSKSAYRPPAPACAVLAEPL